VAAGDYSQGVSGTQEQNLEKRRKNAFLGRLRAKTTGKMQVFHSLKAMPSAEVALGA
jgi:hypothetical protein